MLEKAERRVALLARTLADIDALAAWMLPGLPRFERDLEALKGRIVALRRRLEGIAAEEGSTGGRA